MYVSLGDHCSSTRQITAGVPQGSLLGPVLFIIYISDVPKHQNAHLSMYADDTAIYASSPSVNISTKIVKNYFKKLLEYYQKWKIQVNVNKTEFIIFTRKRKFFPNDRPVKLIQNGLEIKRVNQTKYLGITLQNNLKFTKHIENTIKKSIKALIILYPFIKYKSGLCQSNKLLIYKLYIRPILTYGCAVWNMIPKTQLKKLQVAQNKFIRMALDLRPDPETYKQITTENIHRSSKIVKINEFIYKIGQKTFLKTQSHNNKLIRAITTNVRTNPNEIYKYPSELDIS